MNELLVVRLEIYMYVSAHVPEKNGVKLQNNFNIINLS